MPYLLFFKKQQNLKLSSAANCKWYFMGKVMFFILFFAGDQCIKDVYYCSITEVAIEVSTDEN